MYIENQASGHSPPSLRTIRQPIAFWHIFWEERGGTHRVIGHVTQASSAERCAHSVYSYPMPWKGRKYTRNTQLFMRKHGRPSVALALGLRSVFAYSAPIISFKGIHMKLKVVALAISVE